MRKTAVNFLLSWVPEALLGWICKRMPEATLIRILKDRLESKYRMVPLSRGLAIMQAETCLAEEAEAAKATEAFKVAYRLLQFTTEALIACKEKNGSVVATSDVMEPIDLMGELLTYSQTNLQG
jgi:hypothetical protein